MNCNCKEDIETKLAERLKERWPTGTDHDAELQGYSFTLGGNAMQVRAFMPAKQAAMVPLKTGVPEFKTTSLSMFFSYCPFCGAKA